MPCKKIDNYYYSRVKHYYSTAQVQYSTATQRPNLIYSKTELNLLKDKIKFKQYSKMSLVS